MHRARSCGGLDPNSRGCVKWQLQRQSYVQLLVSGVSLNISIHVLQFVITIIQDWWVLAD